jgi:hypothetical protein
MPYCTSTFRDRALLTAGLLVAAVAGCTALSDDSSGPIVTEPVSHVEDGGAPAGADLATAAVDYLRGHQGELGLAEAGGFVAVELPAGFEGVRRASAQQIHQGLPVLGSTLDVRADGDLFLGFSGTVTRNLDGFDIQPRLGEAEAADIARRELVRFTPTTVSAGEVVSTDLVIAPRDAEGADLAWRVELSMEAPDGASAPEEWVALVQAQSGAVLTALPSSGGCSLWDRLKCSLLPNPAQALCLELVCGGGAEEVCGNGVCAGDETDASCRQDCGCSATTTCDAVAPYGCWCDSDCGGSGDCCSDASTCFLPPEPESDDGTCGWGDKKAGFMDRARLTFYRAKYFAIAEAGGLLKDAPEARDLLLHYLGNSGTDVTIDVDKMLAEIASFADKVKADRKRYGEEAARKAKEQNATGAVTTAIPDETLSHSVEQAESYNWWAAIHRFEYKHVGEVTVTPSGDSWAFAVKSKIVLRDNYDWDPTAPNAGPGGAFNQKELDELNCYGWAKEFWCTGMSEEGELMGVAP